LDSFATRPARANGLQQGSNRSPRLGKPGPLRSFRLKPAVAGSFAEVLNWIESRFAAASTQGARKGFKLKTRAFV